MPSSDEWDSTCQPGEEPSEASSRRQDSRGMSPLVYELFVLGELMEKPMYGYLLHAIARRILGPWRPLSWGMLYPLIGCLEHEGLATSSTQKRQGGFPRRKSGQPRRIYALTPAGRERFLALMLSSPEYSRDTPELFIIKLTKFQFLTPAQRLRVLQWYRGYLDDLRTYYQMARSDLLRNTEISAEERSWIVPSIDARLQPLQTELAWLESMIAACRQATDSERG